MRKQFEEWRQQELSKRLQGGHDKAAKEFEQLESVHWMAWRYVRSAALRGIVIELPSINGSEYDPLAVADYREAVRKNLEAVGLKVKP